MIKKADSIGTLLNSQKLVDTAMSCVSTNLSRTQIADLAHLYQGFKPANIVTAQIAGSDARGADGAWLVLLNHETLADFISWLVSGNESAIWKITPVIIRSRGTPNISESNVAERLKNDGFQLVSRSNVTPAAAAPTIIDSGVDDPHAAYEVARVLRINPDKVVRRLNKPNDSGWTPPAQITVNL